MMLHYHEFKSPIGRVLFVADGQSVCALDFSGYEARMKTLLGRRYGQYSLQRGSDPLALKQRLENYFAGDLRAFEDVSVCTGGSDFQKSVWAALRTIPGGTTWSYKQLAAHIHKPTAARAVGHANSVNPIAIIVPCHRVIGASSALTGYAGGIERKQWLLDHERAFNSGDRLAIQ